MIKLRDDIIFEDPQKRIREYCAIEIYYDYDDKHSINHTISQRDIDSANRLYAMIDRYDNGESERLLSRSNSISKLLSSIPNTDLHAISSENWSILRIDIKKLFAEFFSIKGFDLEKTIKILHLKRPNLFPVLDRFILKFLFYVDTSVLIKIRQTYLGLQALERTRKIIVEQKDEFEKLAKQVSDLPIPLTPVRMFDILCWTAEKWDIRKILNAPYGKPSQSLLSGMGSLYRRVLS